MARCDTTYTALIPRDQRVAELRELAAAENIRLPMPIDMILWYEDRGLVVDLSTGQATVPVVGMPTQSAKAVIHLLRDHIGGL